MGETAQTESASEPAAGWDEDLPTVVRLEHNIFRTDPGAYFRISEHTGEPVLILDLGEGEVVLPLPGIRREFEILSDSPDGLMMSLIAEGLRYVKALRPGDLVPKEILTGEASWEAEPRHARTAYQRLTMQLVSWLTGDEVTFTDPNQLLQIAENARMKEMVNNAFGEAAEAIGIGRQRKEEVVELIESLAREHAYIEALREQFRSIVKMADTIDGVKSTFSTEHAMLEIVMPVVRLIRIAVQEFGEIFKEFDEQNKEILSMLTNIDWQIRCIKKTRDNLYRRLLAWDDILEAWRMAEVRQSSPNERLLRETYRFLAPRFMPVDEWVLMSQLQFIARPGSTEVRW